MRSFARRVCVCERERQGHILAHHLNRGLCVCVCERERERDGVTSQWSVQRVRNRLKGVLIAISLF